MTEFLSQLPNWVEAHPQMAYAVVFLTSIAESLAFVGVLVPGAALMVGFGALIATGHLEFWPTFWSAVAGAVIGDGVSFYLGSHFSEPLGRMWPFSKHPQMIERGMAFFNRYGGKSVVFGRFVGPIRATIPVVAGMMRMPPGRFLAANVSSALAWAPAYLLPGMFVGASLELASEVGLRLAATLLGLLLLLWAVAWSSRKAFDLFQPHAASIVQRLLRWGQVHPKMGEIAHALANPDHPEAKGLAMFATLLMLATLGFGLVLSGVMQGTLFGELDQMVLEALQSFRTPWADHLMVHFSRFTNYPVTVALGLGVLAYLMWKGDGRTAWHWISALAFVFIVPWMLKNALQIPRPEPGIDGLETSWAFPSSHTLRAAVVFGFLAVLVARPMRLSWRWVPYSFASLMISAVALSRLYLGAHWLSDVLGSLTLGLFWVAALGMAYNRHVQHPLNWGGLTVATTSIFVFALLAQTWLHHGEELARYQPQPESIIMEPEVWWLSAWQQLPHYRQDLRDHHDHPMNVQYAGPQGDLSNYLGEHGWKPANSLDWHNALQFFAPSPDLADLPILPQVHNGHHESLNLEKQSGDAQLALRLWATNRYLGDTSHPLWIGNVSQIQRRQLFDLFAFPATGRDFATPFGLLLQDLAGMDTRQPDTERQLVLIRAPSLPATK